MVTKVVTRGQFLLPSPIYPNSYQEPPGAVRPMGQPLFPMNQKPLFLLVVLLSMIYSCSGQKKGNDRLDEKSLLDKELKTQDNAKYGNKHPSIQVVTDPQEVAALRKSMEENIQERNKAAASKKKSLAEAYKSGDKSVVPGIIRILKSKDEKPKKDLLFQLQKRYDDPEKYVIAEQGIIDEVLAAVDDPAFEKDAVQLAGMNELPGYEKKFQARLLSGNSTDIGRICFWLSRRSDPLALEYISRLIRDRTLSPNDLTWTLDGLQSYGKNGSPAIKAQVGELALIIYQAKMVSDDKIEDLKNSVATSDDAETLLECLFDYGDKRVVPLANDILKRKIRVVASVKALIRLEGPRHLEKIYAYLRSKDDFYTGLDLVENIDVKYVDDRMLKEVLVRFSQQKDIKDYLVQRIVNSFISMKAEKYLKDIDAIVTNKAVAGQIKKTYALTRMPVDGIITDLVSNGLIREKPDTSIIRKAKEDASNDPLSFIYGVLEAKKVYFGFDAETDGVPLDYDSLLQVFSQKTGGLLKDMLTWTDIKDEGPNGDFGYTIKVVYNNTAFIVHPETIADWYDIMAVNGLLEKVLERSGSVKRFVSIETGDQTVQYIFGDPRAVQKVVRKYKP
jgi:hypothetical protein